jgi:DNA-binding transcriptional MerR regulator
MPDDELLLRVLATFEDHGRRIAAIEKAIRDANEHTRQVLERNEAERKRLSEAAERRQDQRPGATQQAAGPRP